MLSDATCMAALDSQRIYLSGVEVSDLLTSRFGLSQRRGLALLDARKVVIGSRVSDKNLSIILSYCKQVVDGGSWIQKFRAWSDKNIRGLSS